MNLFHEVFKNSPADYETRTAAAKRYLEAALLCLSLGEGGMAEQMTENAFNLLRHDPLHMRNQQRKDSPGCIEDRKNAAEVVTLLESFGLSDCHVGEIMHAISSYRLTPDADMPEVTQ